MRGTVDDWGRVMQDTALLARAEAVGPGDVSAVAALRHDYDELTCAIALELVRARAKAVAKFGGRAAIMASDVQGIEQASGAAVARYKAGRLRAALGEGAAVADLCCGIGGDTAALCDAGLTVTAIDRDPVRAWMARHNTGGRARAVCMDVADAKIEGAIHLDPARRDESAGRRVWKLDDLRPPPEVIASLIEQAGDHGAAVKLSPGVGLDAVEDRWPDACVEFIAEGSRLVQAVLWTGRLRRAHRGATLINHGTMHTLDGVPNHVPLGPVRRHLFAVHPAVERAGLIHLLAEQHDAALIHPKLGLLSRHTPTESPWLTGFELLAEMPWRPRKVKQWLTQHDGGIVEVKTRGKAVDPNAVARLLRGKGGTPYVVFVLRFDKRVVTLICHRLSPTMG